MPNIILQVYPTLGDRRQMEALRPIGRNVGAYQRDAGGPDRVLQDGRRARLLGHHSRRAPRAFRGARDLARPAVAQRAPRDVHEAPQARPARSRRCRPTTRCGSPSRSRSPTICSRDACSSVSRAATRPAGRTSSASTSASPRPRRTSRAPISGTDSCSGALQDHEDGVGQRPAQLQRAGLRSAVPVREGIPNWPPASRRRSPTVAGRGRRGRDGAWSLGRAEAVHEPAPAAVPGFRREPEHAQVVR